ncbi:hypothetical protein K438DRAFT_781155 [Mycena galopus ATCC 62051]|nr:hypothetical protein K438DRAFT_541459 [Mycena galopus ATCC 62051]KAF8195696.1 hypothetical protein K438DRAFT_781155 [Mycena galopus ATCC 62051]
MDLERNTLIEGTYYLGVPEIRNEVTWKKIDRDYKLVTKESALAETARIEAAAKTTKEKPTDDEKSDNETELQIDTTSLLVPASVTFVALLSPDGFWFAPDGNWKKPTNIAATFADVKLNCLAIVPSDIEIFGADFPTVLQNTEWLLKQVETQGNSKQGVLNWNESPKRSMKLRHVLFQKIEGEADINDIEEMENWPVGANPQAREAIEQMKYTHRVRRVPAYDINGKLIHPLQYRETLMGAIVRTTVTLKHWNIAQRSQDSYTADIENIRVLMKPPKLPTSGTSSHKVTKTDPGSPSKKRRT